MLAKALILLLLLEPVFAQNDSAKYSVDYARIQNAYKSRSSMSFEVSYVAVGGQEKTPSVPSNVVKYYFKNSKVYYNSGSTEVLKNTEYIIGVDNEKKTIVINNSGGFPDNFLPLASLDTFLRSNNVIVNYTEKENSGKGCYTINVKDEKRAFNKMELVFEKSSYLVDKIELYLSPDKVKYYFGDDNGTPSGKDFGIEYRFSNYKFTTITEDVFSINRFVNVSGSEFKGIGKYANYHIIVSFPSHR